MSATNRGSKRIDSDFYPTPTETIDIFLKNYDICKNSSILEPCAGNGNIVEFLKKIGCMTDCFQPLEEEMQVTKATIELLNSYGIGYRIVTKSDLICDYMSILDKQKAHIQISTTWIPCEKAVSTERRIKAIETLYDAGFDVAVRLSPYIPQFVDFERLNSIKCNKIIIEFLRVNHWIKKWLPLDYSDYTVKQSGYQHLPLAKKIEYLSKVTGFDEVSVCEDVTEHYEYWKECVNHNKDDCCNLKK